MGYLNKNITTWCLICIVWLKFADLMGANLVTQGGDSIMPPSKASIIQQRDTMHTGGLPKEYQNLKNQSSKNKWTKRLFRMFVREARSAPKKENKDIIEDYKPYEGKIIRKINIRVLPPFGTSVADPDKIVDDFEFFNNTHALTRKSTIRSILQFKQGNPLHAAVVATSEAQLRSAGYIRDARIAVMPMTHTEDSVDIDVVVLDKWTIGLDLHSLSPSKINLEIFDRNILGSGNRAGIDVIYSNKYDRKFGIGANYFHENFAKRGINLLGSFTDKIREYDIELSAIRPLQPKYDYFGEISYRKQVIHPDRITWDSITPDRREKFSVTLGRAFTLSNDNTIRRIALALRYKMKSPEYKEAAYHDYIKDKRVPYKFTRNQMLLMQLSLYENSYLREYMVYNFGNTEDIPQGYNISAQLGYSHFPDIKDAMYTSLSASYGSSKILKGSLYLQSSISSFFTKDKPFGGVFKFNSRYFTPLFKFKGLRFRQFFTLDYSRLLHPDRYLGDRIYMGEHTSLKMRNWREDRQGVEQLLLKTETDWFSNYEILGFRFLFYTFLDVGWITPRNNLFSSENFNYGLGLGLRLRNNFIVFNTIDIKIGYYPKLEQNGSNSFFKIRSSTPSMPPNFVPSIPEEIMLERD